MLNTDGIRYQLQRIGDILEERLPSDRERRLEEAVGVALDALANHQLTIGERDRCVRRIRELAR